MPLRLGHVSVIVGGSRGIGRALARALARRGSNVVGVGRNSERLTATLADLQQCGPDGEHRTYALDVSAEDDMQRLAGECAAHYGAVDLLVVSAAVAGYEGLPPATRDLPLSAWQRAIEVNLHGPFLANRAFLPMMLDRGQGDILNICSSTTPHGLRGRPLAPGYSASKFALAAFTRALAEEVAGSGVRVNALFPGAVDTPLIAGTALASAYGGSIDPDNLAEVILGLLEVTEGALSPDPYMLPMSKPAVSGVQGS